VVTLLLAVVAIAARGRPLGSAGGSHGGLPGSFWDYTYTTVVVVLVPLLLLGLIAASFIRRRQGRQGSYWQNLLRSLAIWAAFVAFELFLIRHAKDLHFNLQQHRPQQAETGLGRTLNPGQHHSAASRAPRFRWDELVIVLGLLLVVGAILAARRSRKDPKARREIAPEALAAALDEALDDLRTDADLRRAIIAAYARMETALAAAGIPRHPAEAPLEYVERALLSVDTSAEAVRKLTHLFEWARFSHHEPEPSMRDDAVDALIAVRDELRASELTPA
jgi:hypothetical protein